MTGPGEILADRWELVEKIDAGAMGEIFRARHHLLGHTVAVKLLIPEIARDKGAIDRFLREARIAARLQHRNVVRVEDFGVVEETRPFLVMELLRGESLAKRLQREPRLTHAEVLDVVREVGAALDVAHREGIVHRDLKPENIFLARNDDKVTVKVLDFGVAKFTDVLSAAGNATTSNTLVGTPRYMSPEQARASRELDGRSDLWALGMLTYEMLTGRHPFDEEAIAELLVAILTRRVAPPSSVCPELPDSLDDWMERALARNKVDRFSTGAEMARTLAEALDGATSDATGGPHGEAPRRNTLRVERARLTTSVDSPDSGISVPVPTPPPASPAPAPRRGVVWVGLSLAVVGAIAVALWQRPVVRVAASSPPLARVATSVPVAALAAPSPAAPSPAAPSLAAPAVVTPATTEPTPVNDETLAPSARASVRTMRNRRHPHGHPGTRRTTGGMYDPTGI